MKHYSMQSFSDLFLTSLIKPEEIITGGKLETIYELNMPFDFKKIFNEIVIWMVTNDQRNSLLPTIAKHETDEISKTNIFTFDYENFVNCLQDYIDRYSISTTVNYKDETVTSIINYDLVKTIEMTCGTRIKKDVDLISGYYENFTEEIRNEFKLREQKYIVSRYTKLGLKKGR